MAKLPTVQDLGPAPTPQPGQGVAQYRGTTGADFAEGDALIGLGKDLQVASNELWQFKEKTDSIRVEDAWNKYKAAAIDLTAGPQGVLKTLGSDAVNGDLLGKTSSTMTDARQKIAEGLTPEQQARFFQRADVTDLDTHRAVLSHLAQQQVEYGKTVFQGSEAAAKAQIEALPTDPGVFTAARETLMAQADVYLKQNGIADKATADALKGKLNDSLWASRINALLYSQPVLADALFRANEKAITDPELKLVLQSKTREAALAVSATNEAQKVIDDTRANLPSLAPPTRQQQPKEVFQNVVGSLLQREGGYVAKDGKSGAPANFGINQKYNPDVDVKNLTKEGAIAIYKERYWNKIDGDTLAPATALVALDAAALQGPEVAKGLIASAQGDPLEMIRLRRLQLEAIAARDPEQAKNLPAWNKRLDSLQAEVQTLPPTAFQKVSYDTTDPMLQNTSGLPNSRDIAAQLPVMLTQVNKRADELYGPDQGNPDRAAFIRRMTAELHSKVAADVQSFNAIQRQAQGTLLDAVAGVGAGQEGNMVKVGGQAVPPTPITSFAQIQADPKLFRAWQMMDPAAKAAVERLIEHNLRANDQGDVRLFRQTFDRIHLDPADPNKINFYQQIIDPAIANRLSMAQINQLRQELDRDETPGGRSFNQMRKAADVNVSLYFKTNPMFTAQPDRQIAATMKWNEDVGRMIDNYVKNNPPEVASQKVRAMFQTDTPESVVNAKFLQSYINSTPAQGLAQGAAAVVAGQQPAVAPVAMPKDIDTPAKLDAWIRTLPPNVTRFVDPDGKVRAIPPRTGQPPAAATLGAPESAAQPTMDATGKIVPPKAASPAETEIQMPTLVTKETQEQKRERLKREADVRNTDAGVAMVGAAVGAVKAAIKGVEAVGRAGHAVGTAVADVAENLNPTEQQRVVTSFRTMIKSGTYTVASEPIILDALDTGLLTGPEQRVATKMLRALRGAK